MQQNFASYYKPTRYCIISNTTLYGLAVVSCQVQEQVTASHKLGASRLLAILRVNNNCYALKNKSCQNVLVYKSKY